MASICPSCKVPVRQQDTRCQNCGMRLTHPGTPVSSSQPTVPAPPLAYGTPTPPGAGALQPGALIANRYRLEAVVGQGAMGEVWRGRDEHLAGRVRAIKRVLVGGATPQEQAERESWLKREAAILASLSHPAICDIFDVLEDGGSWYLILEWIEGRTLAEELSAHGARALPEAEVLGWAATLCSALTLLHGQQPPVIFRDLKPQNIMLRATDRTAKLIDFGIARPMATSGATVIGTPGYAPPEQYHGTVDARSDQYALAATLHQLLTGRDPTQQQPWDFPPARALAPAISPRLEAALERALSMRAGDRFSTVADFAAALAPAIVPARKPAPIKPRPVTPAPYPPAPQPRPAPAPPALVIGQQRHGSGMIALGAIVGLICGVLPWWGGIPAGGAVTQFWCPWGLSAARFFGNWNWQLDVQYKGLLMVLLLALTTVVVLSSRARSAVVTRSAAHRLWPWLALISSGMVIYNMVDVVGTNAGSTPFNILLNSGYGLLITYCVMAPCALLLVAGAFRMIRQPAQHP